MKQELSLYYLTTHMDEEEHDEVCCCATPTDMPHRAYGVGVYKLDREGLQKLHSLVTGMHEDSFNDWLGEQEFDGVYYGASEDTAIAEALIQAKKEKGIIINYPPSSPWLELLLNALMGIVGEDGYLDAVCECDPAEDGKEKTICFICYARAIFNIVSASWPRRNTTSVNDLVVEPPHSTAPLPLSPPAYIQNSLTAVNDFVNTYHGFPKPLLSYIEQRKQQLAAHGWELFYEERDDIYKVKPHLTYTQEDAAFLTTLKNML